MAQADLTTGPLGKQIFRFSIPLIFSNLLQVLFNMADVAVVGRFAGPTALGAVGSTTIFVSLFTGFLIGLSGGVNVLVAHHFGADDQKNLSDTVHSAALTCAAAETAKAVSAERTMTLVQALTAMPQGVEAMDTDFPGLVQTSLNMGVVKLDGDGLHIAFSIRSSIASRKLMLAQRVRAVAALAGGTVAERGVYPGWQYKRESRFRDTLLAAYKDLTGKDGVVEATHGGLECGLLMEKIPGLDAVSMGPELHDVHSVRERLSVPSTERTYELVCELLRRSC